MTEPYEMHTSSPSSSASGEKSSKDSESSSHRNAGADASLWLTISAMGHMASHGGVWSPKSAVKVREPTHDSAQKNSACVTGSGICFCSRSASCAKWDLSTRSSSTRGGNCSSANSLSLQFSGVENDAGMTSM